MILGELTWAPGAYEAIRELSKPPKKPCCLCKTPTPGPWFSDEVLHVFESIWVERMHYATSPLEQFLLSQQRPDNGSLCLRHFIMTSESDTFELLSDIIKRELATP